MTGYDINKVSFEDESGKDKSEMLTGNYIQGLPPNSNIEPNSELEQKEYVQFPDGITQKVVGKDHEKGGVKMYLPDGTKVISKSLYPTKSQINTLEKDFDLKIGKQDTYADVIDKYSKKIGLKKLNEEEEDIFETLEKELSKKNVDQKTASINRAYISEKISKLEQQKKPLEEDRAKFFNTVFEMQEQSKKTMKLEKDKDQEFKYGGVSKKNFEAMCKRMGLDPEKTIQELKDKRNGNTPKFDGGGIIISKDKMAPTGASLSQEEKNSLLAYYSKYNKNLAEALKTGKLKWEDHVFNPGLVQDLKTRKPEDIPTGYQNRDQNAQGLSAAGTYGGLSNERVSGFLLKDYYERKNPGKKFENISKEEVGQLQKEYNEALSKGGLNYYSGVKGDTEVSDNAFGNRTSSYIRKKEVVKGAKEGIIDVDALYGKTPEEINNELKPYNLTYDDIKDYQNAAVKYIEITPNDIVTGEVAKPKDEATTKTYEGKEGPLRDMVTKGVIPRKEMPKMFFSPSERVLAPSPMQAHLKADVRLQRIDPVKIGIDQTLQGIGEQRDFVAEQVQNLPASQRAAVIANLAANSQKTISQAETQANTINAQNLSQAELFNIQQAGQEELYGVNNALNYEQRQLTAQAKAEESIQQYYDYNRRLNVKNFQNNQKLNLLDSLYSDFDIDYFGTGVTYNPKTEFRPNITYTMTDQFGNEREVTRQMTEQEYEQERRKDILGSLTALDYLA